jgi:ketosteroid isomerase-like protein
MCPEVSVNLDLVRSIYAAWERGDYTSTEWAHPEIEFGFADGPTPGRWMRPNGLVEGFREWISAWEDWRVAVEEIRELDDERLLVLLRGAGRGKASGFELGQMQTKAANVLHVQGGKVTRLIIYFERERAFADLGLKD